MNISSVSSGASAGVSAFGDDIIKQLMKQKEQLQKQIQSTNESKMDPRTKQETIAQLQQQIQDIDAEILQRQREKLAPKQKQGVDDKQANDQSNSAGVYIGDGADMGPAGMSGLIQANAVYSQLKTMNGIKEGLTGRGNVFKQEIKIIEQKGGKALYQRGELQKGEEIKRSLDKKIGEAGQKLEKHIEEASEKAEESRAGSVENSREAAYENAEASDGAGKEVPQEGESAIKHKVYKKIDVIV